VFNLLPRWVFRTIAIARGKDEEELVKKLGARLYIDNRSQNAVEELTNWGEPKSYLQQYQVEKP
jgi:D-arabinose 1-dehydrogenase-like Zn-dependent alcohol dehydrogenase